MPILETVPNFSEGRRPEVIAAIAACFDRPGVWLLDTQTDADHNRTVVSAAGDPPAVLEALFAATAEAARLIDLRQHRGAHPRLGATDVIPLIPIEGLSMDDCVAYSHTLGERIARELGIPVYLYERSATRPERRNLAEIRRGEFEGLREAIRDPARRPDYGPAAVHPGAGATVVGARPPLVAFNAYLDTGRLEVAKAVARAVRASSGGLAGVKALGMDLPGQGAVQVSMNLVDTEATPIHRALELAKIEAARYGARVTRTEIVGLVPLAALVEAAGFYLQLDGFSARQVLEVRLREAEKGG